MYDLHRLGWHSFQQLCLTVTREILGQTVECYLDSADGGRDGAFAGTWLQKSGESLSGRFVIQCKFTGKLGRNLRKEDLSDEAEKAHRLVHRDLCNIYILMTNAGISGTAAEDIELLFKQAGVKHVVLFGSTWICDQIRVNKRLRMMVPRIYGLGDLSQILDERAYGQARALLNSLRDELSKVVITSAYRRAADALNRHGLVLLIGEPAAGKTTIASMLSMAALDQWGCSTLKLDDATKVIEHWNPEEPESEPQFFWIDDAFGVMQYESFLVNGWNHALPQMNAMLRKGTKIVMTSRDYIYKRARNDLKESALPLLKESQVVIDVQDLTADEREQILYNHIKMGEQPKEMRAKIKPHLAYIAAHPRFIPETARRLGDPLFTRNLPLCRSDVAEFVEKQEQLMQEVLGGLDEHSKAAIGLIYMRNGILESPITLEETERDAIDRLGSNLGSCRMALECLNGSLVQHVQTDGTALWRLKHPTVGDAYAVMLLKSPDLLGIYVRGSSMNNLMTQVTCGDVGLERAVPLPAPLFPLVLERLGEFASTDYKSPYLAEWSRQRRIDHFLTHRCSKEFLTIYIEEYPEMLARIASPGLMLEACSEVSLAVRLHELGLLPEKLRTAFVEKINEYTFEGIDLYAIDNGSIQSIYTTDELSEFRRRLREELVPNLSDIRYDWQSNRDLNCDPNSHIQPFIDGLHSLKNEFAGEPAILAGIDSEVTFALEWAAETEAEDDKPKEPPSRHILSDVQTQDQPRAQARSIFDDVDE